MERSVTIRFGMILIGVALAVIVMVLGYRTGHLTLIDLAIATVVISIITEVLLERIGVL